MSGSAGELIKAAMTFAAHGERFQALEAARATGDTATVRHLEKSSIAAGSTGDDPWGGALTAPVSAFMPLLRTGSIFFRLVDDGALRRAPFDTRLALPIGGATAYVVAEGAPTPVSKLTLGPDFLRPVLVQTLAVITSELARSGEAAAQAYVAAELRGALAPLVDSTFFGMIMDTGTPSVASTGSDAEALLADLRGLLHAVNESGASRLQWAAAPDVANLLSTIGHVAFLGVGPLGGELLSLPLTVTNGVPAGTLRLIDGASIVGNASTIALDIARHASLQFETEPTVNSVEPTPTELVSLWQAGGVAFRVGALIGATRTRAAAVAELTDIDTSPTS